MSSECQRANCEDQLSLGEQYNYIQYTKFLAQRAQFFMRIANMELLKSIDEPFGSDQLASNMHGTPCILPCMLVASR